ncbi:hypothetical protein BC629DRAFT_1597358 [Irpex lacteus]|nr:hypothetical protein BC629DRAFT_1597358 [Irpex lacteus]
MEIKHSMILGRPNTLYQDPAQYLPTPKAKAKTDALFELIPPPAQRAIARTTGPGAGGNPSAVDLMMMGFPTRLPVTSPPALCVCHSELKSEGFLCPRCLRRTHRL